MTGRFAVRGTMAALTLLMCAWSGSVAREVGVYGRVRVSTADEPEAAPMLFVERALEARFATAPGRSHADVRLISLGASEDDPERFEATVYDYAVEQGFELTLDRAGSEISRRPLEGQPALSDAELEEARTIVASEPQWSGGIAARKVQLYAPMPGVTQGEDGARLINVGLLTRSAKDEVQGHEIVSVHLPTRRIVRHPLGAPPTALATLTTCGPLADDCNAPGGACPLYHYEWPAASPVWKFDVLHPSCTPAIQGDGTGLEIQNLSYRNRLVLARGDVPVLNVQYEGNLCGPYRDWLFSESCFEASGTAVSPGIVVGNGTPVTSICDTGNDAGNFRGVAIEDLGSELRLVTEQMAGWYRYVMEWRLGLDGTLEPIFGFGAVANSCTCNHHHHHAYFRFEFALDGTPGVPSTGISTLERAAGSPGAWNTIFSEGSFVRPQQDLTADRWRIRNAGTGLTCQITPRAADGSAAGDAYAKADVWALALNSGQINDPETDTTINIDPWINGEALGASKRLVVWYRTGFDHDHDTAGDDCHVSGPILRFTRTCPAVVVLDHALYGCNQSASISVDDDDFIGAGSLEVDVHSTAEPVPETATLTETPAWSGHFEGSIPLTSQAPIAGDGRVSTEDGDTLSVHYLDAASCGAVNVELQQTASVDCAAPAISGVAVSAITTSSATVSWTTGEAGSSKLSYGSSIPPQQLLENGSPVLSHTLSLSGLSACTTYWFAVSSTDAVGNVATDTNGEAYYSFTTTGPVPCAPSLSEQSHSVTDRCGAAPPDGVDPGDALVIEVTAQNSGFLGTTHVTGTLSTTTQGVTILDGSVSFPDLPGQTSAAGTTHLLVSVESQVPCQTPIELMIHFSSDQGSWDDSFTVPVVIGCKICTAGPPSEEVLDLQWLAGSAALGWAPATGAGWYQLARGTELEFPALLTTDLDSCLRALTGDTSTDPVLTETPPSGSLFWYLVIAANGAGTGGAGQASAGPRILDISGACP